MEDIFDNYINDLIRVNPIINDFFLREEFLDKKIISKYMMYICHN